MTAPSRKDASTHVNCTVTIVGDLGEATSVRFRHDLRKLFGDWVDPDFPAGGALFDIQADGQGENDFEAVAFDIDAGGVGPDEPGLVEPLPEPIDPPDDERAEYTGDYPPLGPYAVDFRRTLYIGGPHHWIHNLEEGMPGVLTLWTWFIERLKHERCYKWSVICRCHMNKYHVSFHLNRFLPFFPKHIS